MSNLLRIFVCCTICYVANKSKNIYNFMKEEITRENLANYLAVFFETNETNIDTVAKAIGCPIASLERIIGQESYPTDEMIKQCAIMISIGIVKYKKLSDSDKETISDKIGAVGGGVLGFGAITSAIGASGSVIGLSAAGITSGLSGIGALVGGGMAAGATAVAAIPIAVGAAGYGLMKAIKFAISYYKLNNKDINPYWEILRQDYLVKA
mgnify:FL=1